MIKKFAKFIFSFTLLSQLIKVKNIPFTFAIYISEDIKDKYQTEQKKILRLIVCIYVLDFFKTYNMIMLFFLQNPNERKSQKNDVCRRLSIMG